MGHNGCMTTRQGRFTRWWEARTPLVRIVLFTASLLLLFLAMDLLLFRRLSSPVMWVGGAVMALLLAWSLEWQRRRERELSEQDRRPPARG